MEALGNELEMEDDPSEPSYLEEPEPKAAEIPSGIEHAGSVPNKVVSSSLVHLFHCYFIFKNVCQELDDFGLPKEPAAKVSV